MYDERIDGAPVTADEGLMVPAKPMGKVVMPKIRCTAENVTASDYNMRAFACSLEFRALKKGAWCSVIINGIEYKGIADVYEDGVYIAWGASDAEAVGVWLNENGDTELWILPVAFDEAWDESEEGITVEIREAKGVNVADAIMVKNATGIFPAKLHKEDSGFIAPIMPE